MKTESLKRLAVLGLSSEQMAVVLDVLAVELAPMERTRELAAQRQQRYVERNTNVRLTSPAQRQDNVITEPSRVEDNISKSSLLVEESKKEEKENLTVFQKETASKPLPSEPKGFSEFWAIYPRRAGGNDKIPAMKGFAAAVRRAGNLETILAGATRYRAHCDAKGITGGDYVLKARKWLNSQSWNENYGTDEKLSGQTREEHLRILRA